MTDAKGRLARIRRKFPGTDLIGGRALMIIADTIKRQDLFPI